LPPQALDDLGEDGLPVIRVRSGVVTGQESEIAAARRKRCLFVRGHTEFCQEGTKYLTVTPPFVRPEEAEPGNRSGDIAPRPLLGLVALGQGEEEVPCLILASQFEFGRQTFHQPSPTVTIPGARRPHLRVSEDSLARQQ